ncbi:hypothetical protein DFH06DRAFT_1148304 [Mycena polygramma]|nr:hypothetical protein DFH06DRAFT_1148304 [Mycena polygramma]
MCMPEKVFWNLLGLDTGTSGPTRTRTRENRTRVRVGSKPVRVTRGSSTHPRVAKPVGIPAPFHEWILIWRSPMRINSTFGIKFRKNPRVHGSGTRVGDGSGIATRIPVPVHTRGGPLLSRLRVGPGKDIRNLKESKTPDTSLYGIFLPMGRWGHDSPNHNNFEVAGQWSAQHRGHESLVLVGIRGNANVEAAQFWHGGEIETARIWDCGLKEGCQKER